MLFLSNMYALPLFFDDALLDDYEEAMEVADPLSAATPQAAPVLVPATISTPPTIEVPAPIGVPAPTVAPSTITTSIVTPTSTKVAGSNIDIKKSSNFDRTNRQCRICSTKSKHPLRFCPAFRKMSHEQRLRMVILHHYCARCLAHSHTAKQCVSTFKCRECKGDHNLLLHPSSARFPSKPQKPKNQTSERPISRSGQAIAHKRNTPALPSSFTSSMSQASVLPIRHVVTFSPTLVAKLYLPKNTIAVRAALDPCCKVSYICESLVYQLRLPTSTVDDDRYCRLTVGSSFDSSKKIHFTAKVSRMRGIPTPTESVSDAVKEQFVGFQLADENFNRAGRVVLVLGPEITPQVILNRTYSSPGLPLAQLTIFGWVISGQSPL